MPGGIILKKIAGGQAYWLERDNNFKFNFYHFSPGTGTRLATIGVENVEESDKLKFLLSWSTNNISLSVGAVGVGASNLHTANGINSSKGMRIVGNDIAWVGDSGVTISGVRMVSNGKVLLEPTAIELWKETIREIGFLRDGFVDKDFLHERAKNNSTIRMIVTGFEIYCKKRIVELEKEGVEPDMDALVDIIFSKYEREKNYPENIKRNAEEDGNTFLEALALKRINFQSYNECKTRFAKAYGIKFGNIGISSNKLDTIQKTIRFRHKLVHVSPALTMVNYPNHSVKNPIFADNDYTEKAIEIFDEFIDKFHEKTLELNRND